MPGQKAPEEQRREQILAAAFRVAVRDGLGGLTVREVAVDAGLSKGLVFFHYGSKDGLLEALLEQLVDWLLDVPEPATERTPAARLLAQMSGDTGMSGADRDRIDLLLQYVVLSARRPQLRARAAEGVRNYRRLLRQPAKELLEESGVPGADRAANGIASLAASVVIGSALQAYLDDSFSGESVIDGLRTLVDLPSRPR